MKNPLKNVKTDEILEDAGTLLSASFTSTNMKEKWDLFNEAQQLKKIYKEIVKWESMTRGY